MKAIIDRLAKEPAFLGGLLNLVIPALVIFEIVGWDGTQVGTATGIVGFLTGLGVRSQVSPASSDQPDFSDLDTTDYEGV